MMSHYIPTEKSDDQEGDNDDGNEEDEENDDGNDDGKEKVIIADWMKDDNN